MQNHEYANITITKTDEHPLLGKRVRFGAHSGVLVGVNPTVTLENGLSNEHRNCFLVQLDHNPERPFTNTMYRGYYRTEQPLTEVTDG